MSRHHSSYPLSQWERSDLNDETVTLPRKIGEQEIGQIEWWNYPHHDAVVD